MDTLQFSLFFAALCVAYVLVHIRLAKFEAYLKEIAGLKLLNERLKGVSDVLERVRLDRVEELLAMLHEDLVEIAGIDQWIEKMVGRSASAAPAAALGQRTEVESSAGDRVRAAVEARLLALGYGDLRILSELGGAQLDEQLEVQVECVKNHMPFKGTVVARNGGIADVQLQSVSQTFP